MSYSRTIWLLLAAALSALAVASLALADERYPVSNAHILEHQTATEFVDRAKAAAAKGDWYRACSLYQEALDRYPNHVVPIDDGAYEGLADNVTRALAAMPEAGKKAYREMFDQRFQLASGAAFQARDTEAMLALARRYPLASDSPKALAMAAAILCERGDIIGADAVVAGRVRSERLSASISPQMIAQIAIAACLSGDRNVLEEMRTTTTPSNAALLKATVTVRGKEQQFGSLLKELLERVAVRGPGSATAAAAGKPDSADEWTHFGGGPDRNSRMPALESLHKQAWREKVPFGAGRVVEGMRGWYAEGPEEPEMPARQRPTMHPVVGLGTVFLHNDLAVFAYHLLGPDKRLLWKFEEKGYRPEEVMDDERVDHTCTLSDGRLFANIVTYMGDHEVKLGWLTVKYPIPRRGLFAFDARTGKVLWQLGGQPGTPEFPAAASLPHAPAAVGNWLYAGATHALYTTDPPDHYVFCIDASTGKLRWSTFIASAVLDINLFNNPTRETIGSPVSVSGDIAYYCTNIGVVAALERSSGRIVWLRRYRHIPTAMPRNAYMPPRRPQGWGNNPPIVADGKLIVTPTDSPFIYVFDALTGKELARRAREDLRGECAAGDFKHVLGADKNMVVVSCPHVVAALSLEDGRLLSPKWRCLLSPESCLGRGALAGGSVLVPCNMVLMRVDLASGKLLNRWAWQPLGGEQLGSNVLVTETAVITASSQMLRAFYSPEKVEQALAAELAACPDKPDVLYRVGLSYLRTVKRPEGIGLIEKAAGIAAKSRDREMEALAVQCRRSLFDIYLESAEAGRLALAPQARSDYETAKRWAPDGECYVRATVKYAARLLKAGALDECVAQYSEIITAYADVQYESLRAGDFAQGEIAKLISAHGRAPYAAVEQKAATALETARKSGLHQKFMRVFTNFPNSQAAEQALLEAARNATKEKSWDSVMEALRVFLRQFPGSKTELEAELMLLQAYESKQMPAAARNVLRTLLQNYADREIDAEGSKLTVREFVERRLNSELYAGKQPPQGARQSISPPLSLAWRHTAAQGVNLTVLVPGSLDKFRPSTEWCTLDRLFLAMTDCILCLSTSTGVLQWELPVPGGVSDTTPWLHERYLIFSSGATLTAVDVTSGMVTWSTVFDTHVVNMVLCDGMVHAATFDRQSPDDLWIHTVDANTGAIRWHQSVVQFHSEGMLIVGEHLVLYSVQRPILVACPRLSGDPPRRIQLNGRVNSVVPATHDSVIVVTTDLYARAIAIPDGDERWNARLGPVFDSGDLFASTTDLLIYFQQGTPRNRLVFVDLNSGKMRLRRDLTGDGYQRGWWLLNDRIYAMFTDRSRGNAIVQALEMLEGEVRMQFIPPQVDRRTELRPLASGNFLVFDSSSASQPDAAQPTRWTPNVFIVDANSGALVQTLGAGDLAATTSVPKVFLCGDHLLILQGETLSAFRAK